MNKYILILFISVSISLFAQVDTTRKEFYPLHVGDVWQYSDENFNLYTFSIYKDTIIENDVFFVFSNVLLKSSGKLTRIDSDLRIQNRRGSPTAGDSCGGNNPYEYSNYHLGEHDSTSWEICEDFNGFLGFPLIRFNETYELSIFGQHREVMFFDYGAATIEGDTIWEYGGALARGIGVIEERYYEGGYLLLQGAIIDGEKYGTIVSVDEIYGNFPVSLNQVPEEFIIKQNYPNPFNPTTTIEYELSHESEIKVSIYDLLGREIKILHEGRLTAGNHKIKWDAGAFASGVYLCRMKINENIKTLKMILTK